MKKHLLLIFSLFLFAAGSLHAADYYWVGGGGNWSDINHWRLGSSTGGTPSIVPSAADNVFFTVNSGFGTTTAQKTVLLDANGFCHSMTWDNVANSPIFNRSNNSYTVEISGDLSMSPDVTYNIQVIFKGATDNTIKTSGPVLGYLGVEVNKLNGKLSLLDSLICNTTNRTNNLALTAGTLDLSGKKVTMVQFNSNNANVRTLNITGASLSFEYRWDFRGLNKTLLADGSDIYKTGYLLTDGGNYTNVENNGKDNNNFSVNNTTFSKLIFINENAGSYAQVNVGNQVDSLIFKGRGRIFDDNTIHYLSFEMAGSVVGLNNTIHYMKNADNLNVDKGALTVDSLLLAANKASTFKGLLTINNYLEASGVSCEAFTELTGDTTSFKLVFGPAATASINNVLLTGMRATGPITPLAISGIDGGGNQGFVINPPASSVASTFYWVGGAGDWNDNTHWSTTSGGTGGACIPFIKDDVIFDGNSGFAAGNNTVSSVGNIYCHNMTWTSSVATAIFNESTADKCLVYGSVILAPTVTMNAMLELNGSEATTVTTNGATTGTLQLQITKADAGLVKLVDDWTNATATITLMDGTVDLSERNVFISTITSTQTYPARHIDITNADIHVNYAWRFTGLYKFIQSGGSVITSDYIFVANGLKYPEVNLTYAGANDAFNIYSTTFDSLTFTSAVATSIANINGNNTIRRLEFKGAGSIAAGGNEIDSLILGASRNYKFTDLTSINKYMSASSVPCTGLSELRGNPGGTLAFDPAAKVEISNVYMMNMTATGQTPAFTGADAGGNTGWAINTAVGSARYWIAGAGDWNDASHWSTTSGGAPGACIPTVYDDVIFDAASGFTAGNNVVTVNNGNAYCHNMDWSTATNVPNLVKAAAWNIEVWGESLVLNKDAFFNVSPLTLKGPTATTLMGTVTGKFDINIDKQGSSLTIANDFTNTQTNINLINGAFNAIGRKLDIGNFDNQGLNNAMDVNIEGSAIKLKSWRYSGDSTVHGLSTLGSNLNTVIFNATGKGYDTVSVGGNLSTHSVMGGTQINKLTFTDTDGASHIGINGAGNKIGTLTFKGGGAVYGTGNVIDTLIFFPGSSYTFTAGTNTTINDAWYGSGTPCRLTEILNDGGSNATITRTSGSATFDYIRLKGITAVGTSPFEAAAHSIDLGGNTGWNIEAYDGAQPINGLGDDRAIPETDFPYTVHTDGFFGTPLAKYSWGDGSQLDSLVITDTGTYKVEVRFEDGCTVTDSVHITYAIPLPVELTSFDIDVKNCTPVLHWTIGQQVNFKQFEVERSTDGSSFQTLSKVLSSFATNEYTYADNNASENIHYYYRLKLVDNSDKLYGYSKTKIANMDCAVGNINVYPNPTSGIVNVSLPINFDNVKINVYSVAGHKLTADVKSNGKNYLVNLSHLATGIYFIEVLHDGYSQKFKVLKK